MEDDDEFDPRIFEMGVDTSDLSPDELLRRAEVLRDRYKEALEWREQWYACVVALKKLGYGYKSLAGILGMPISTVRQIVNRKGK